LPAPPLPPVRELKVEEEEVLVVPTSPVVLVVAEEFDYEVPVELEV
jgi:hypothetical protein